MAREISFPDVEPMYVSDRDCLSFRALADGKPVECLVTGELLLSRFGARDLTEGPMRQAYQEHLAEIREIARDHIQNGWVDGEGRLFLTTRFTRLKVTFGGRLGEWAEGRKLADDAHRILTDLIGPHAETVEVEWGGEEVPAGQPGISVRIVDPAFRYSVTGFLGPKETGDPTRLLFYLAGLWGDILRERSRKLLLKMG